MIPGFTMRLLRWNKEGNTRLMPWKGEKDPYKIWLSEIILQQTRVEQGRSYYQKFIEVFPTIHHLAHASAKKVFKLWEGLGYYNRCRNLIETAKRISRQFKGQFPSSYEQILQLKGIGSEIASVLYFEGLFRSFGNRRQLAAYAGLAPTPWRSGTIDQEQGISKAGNPRLRSTMIELAWLWQRHQPASTLSRWFHTRVGNERGRIRRISIVALARKLLIAVWRYVTQGEVPEGAVLKAA